MDENKKYWFDPWYVQVWHKFHPWWNRSRLNKKWDPLVGSCACCCPWCQERFDRDYRKLLKRWKKAQPSG